MRVLIVDDDEIFCQLLAEVLENKGMQVLWTTGRTLGLREIHLRVLRPFYSRRAHAAGLGYRTH